MHRNRGVRVLCAAFALAIAAAGCEKEKDSAVKADGYTEWTTTTTITTVAAAPASTTTTTSTVQPTTTTTVKPRPTTTTTARPRPTTTTTAEPEPAPAPATSSCHSSYRGTCIPPDVSDADCAGGTGNGPWYVQEKNIAVVGPDVFGLDGNDNDGIGCESR